MPSNDAKRLLVWVSQHPEDAEKFNWVNIAKDEPDLNINQIADDLGFAHLSPLGKDIQRKYSEYEKELSQYPESDQYLNPKVSMGVDEPSATPSFGRPDFSDIGAGGRAYKALTQETGMSEFELDKYLNKNVKRKVQAFGGGVASGMTFGWAKDKEVAEAYPFIEGMGDVVGTLLPISGIAGGVKVGMGAVKIGLKVGESALKAIGKTALAEGVSGGVYSGLKQTIKGEFDPTAIATEAVTWAGLGAGFKGLGKIVSKLKDARTVTRQAKVLKEEIESYGGVKKPLDEYRKFIQGGGKFENKSADVYPESVTSKAGLKQQLVEESTAAELESKKALGLKQKGMPQDVTIPSKTDDELRVARTAMREQLMDNVSTIEDEIEGLSNRLRQNITTDESQVIGKQIENLSGKLDTIDPAGIYRKPSKLSSEAGFASFPSLDDLRQVRDRAIKGANKIDPFGMPGDKIVYHPIGEKFTNMLEKSYAFGRAIEGRIGVISDTIKRPSRVLPSGRKKIELAAETWMERYEKGLPQETPELQELADKFKEITGIPVPIAQQLDVKVSHQITKTGKRGGTITKTIVKEFQPRENYVPHYATHDGYITMVSQTGKVWDALIQKLKDDGKYFKGIEEYIRSNADKGRIIIEKSGSLEKERTLDLPLWVIVDGKRVNIIETNPYNIIKKYGDNVSKRLGIISQFGQDDKVIKQILKDSYDDMYVHDKIKDMWGFMNDVDKRYYNNGFMRIFRPLEALVMAGQLSGATVSNIFGFVPSAMKYRLIDTIKGMTDVMTAKLGNIPAAERIKILRMDDAFGRDMFTNLAMTEGITGATSKITHATFKVSGMSLVNRAINKAASGAAIRSFEHGLEIIRRGDDNLFKKIYGGDSATYIRQFKRDYRFTDADISDMLKNGISKEQRAIIVQKAPALTNAYGESVANRPLWMRHPISQRVFAYTSFPRAMGNIAKYATVEAAHGNVVPLAKWLGGSLAAGEGIIWLKNYLKNKERQDKNIYARLFNDMLAAASFGVMGEIGQSLYYDVSSGVKPGEAVTNIMTDMPVLNGLAEDFTSALESIQKKSFVPFARNKVKNLPAARIARGMAIRILDPHEAKRERKYGLKVKKYKKYDLWNTKEALILE